ncbi:hypothetical protein QCA50_020494 [Cerrena zonata]|uniref:ATP synthase F(0) complex subunit e, mitochondrial n=2 Tax=Dikarya TaxID=451864 RepID=A0A1E4RFA1_9ASCO|nr:hypothetical protein HYPBUDRAFT_126736 [Hyphopichia burtonii NRRL Y-1933]ODV65805.1 hypothetical protein HYPBUDRAFT_126736 [Hyphopichia burtonii NRRL Y-1933]
MSTQFNVLRWSFLGFGIVYGAYHRYGLESTAKQQQVDAAYKKEEALIKQAKAEYAKLHPAKSAAPASGSINWEDPNLDIGKALESLIQKLD